MKSSPSNWKPSASLDKLRQRARMLAQIRAFFAKRGVLEVETPLLSAACMPEPMIAPLVTDYTGPGGRRRLYLQSSPEAAMKRLLAADSGSIYQITRAFRDGEAGRLHNPEFSILEWYRIGYTHHDLMREVDEFLQEILACAGAERISYVDLFLRETGLDPLNTPLSELRNYAAQWGVHDAALGRDSCLQLILSHKIELGLGHEHPAFIYDFPASQAALARNCPDKPGLAERFEVYVLGVELANGFHELTDAAEQRGRFEADIAKRRELGFVIPPLDERFLAALAAGMPPCAGVAVGLDRLLMLLTGALNIVDVLAFPLERA
ncbi:MAG: EF-P lysine aminoacylase GenX [Gammaproteobacteria bacterium]|nr:EF-P lysine aminoacylase GenX [Gammaproteobacteria bacterium]